jgi:transposase
VANITTKITLGIDVAKDQLVICNWISQEIIEIDNDPKVIKTWLQTFSAPLRIAIEPTSTYHIAAVEAALALDHQVYLINPRQLHHYRDAINVRNKTDPVDAWLLARYLEHEVISLRPFRPQSRQAQQLWALLKRRAVVVDARKKVQQSFKGIQLSNRAFVTSCQQLIYRIEQRIRQLINSLGWLAEYRFCRSVPGIGKINAAALVCAYHRGAFSGSDAFIAFIGLDVRVRESGRYRGKRKLTKRGEAEIRRLLYCASQAARSYPLFDVYYQRQLDKGLSKIAAKNILARKLARIAFTLIRTQQMFVKREVMTG